MSVPTVPGARRRFAGVIARVAAATIVVAAVLGPGTAAGAATPADPLGHLVLTSVPGYAPDADGLNGPLTAATIGLINDWRVLPSGVYAKAVSATTRTFASKGQASRLEVNVVHLPDASQAAAFVVQYATYPLKYDAQVVVGAMGGTHPLPYVAADRVRLGSLSLDLVAAHRGSYAAMVAEAPPVAGDATILGLLRAQWDRLPGGDSSLTPASGSRAAHDLGWGLLVAAGVGAVIAADRWRRRATASPDRRTATAAPTSPG